MALPKKRRKLENNSGSGSATRVSGNKAAEKKGGTKNSAKKPKSSAQMDKAFEIIEQIENANHIPVTPATQKSRSGQPGRLRLRITLEGSAPASQDTAKENNTPGKKAREVDIGITIPSFVWKAPILKKAAQKILQKFSSQG